MIEERLKEAIKWLEDNGITEAMLNDPYWSGYYDGMKTALVYMHYCIENEGD